MRSAVASLNHSTVKTSFITVIAISMNLIGLVVISSCHIHGSGLRSGSYRTTVFVSLSLSRGGGGGGGGGRPHRANAGADGWSARLRRRRVPPLPSPAESAPLPSLAGRPAAFVASRLVAASFVEGAARAPSRKPAASVPAT